MGTYEVLFILPPTLEEGDVTATIDEFRGIAETGGVKTVSEDAWGRRRLAYPIQKKNDGIYHLFVFEGAPGSLDDFDRRMKNSDKIMRHMIVRTDLETQRARKKGVYPVKSTDEREAERAAARATRDEERRAARGASDDRKEPSAASEPAAAKPERAAAKPEPAAAKPEPAPETASKADAGSEEE
ncbi:MAG: 30S ribosomal protein S6 [Acidobacteria bacterium]|nr:30S ribosomal protein S6 [Acidobacteriota bacterium]